MKKLLLIFLLISVSLSMAFAVPGEIHLLYNNGQIVEDNGVTYYEFDIQAYITGGQAVLSAGMVYIEYPISIFGESVISNGSVIVEKTGLLAETIPNVGIDLYEFYDNDSDSGMFVLGFETPFADDMSMIQYFSELSTDSQDPSNLFNVKIEVVDYGVGTVIFPPSIPGELFYDFEWEPFNDGVNISQANEPVVYEEVINGGINYTEFKARWFMGNLRLTWKTDYESDLEGFVVKRSINGGSYSTLSSYLTNPALEAHNGNNEETYRYYDTNANFYTRYIYYVEAIDEAGNVYPTDIINVLGIFIAYPNPFNPSFVVPFELTQAQDVNIKLYDMSGRLVKDVANGTHGIGSYEYRVNCDDLSSGIYILRTIVDDVASTQKMLLVK